MLLNSELSGITIRYRNGILINKFQVIKHFSRLLKDEQAGIRTNTTVCLGKIARYLHHTTRQKVLAGAFGGKTFRTLPFPY